MTLVLDASLTVAALGGEQRTVEARAIMMEVRVRPTWVPSLWRLEVANVLRNLVRKGLMTSSFMDGALGDLSLLPIAVDPQTDAQAWGPTLALAREESLTVYDAAYLELAVRRQATLATLDIDLVRAAHRRGVDVLPS